MNRDIEIIQKNGSHYVMRNGKEISHHGSLSDAEMVRNGLLTAQAHRVSQAAVRAAEEQHRSQSAEREQERGVEYER